MVNDDNGIEFVYPIKQTSDYARFTMNNSDPESDSHLHLGGQVDHLVNMGSGWWTVDNAEAVRINVAQDPAFEDTIDGCNDNFDELTSRGYAWKAGDWRDVEFSVIADVRDLNDQLTFKGPTGHHTDSNCCQGFAYGMRFIPGAPLRMQWLKEQWHPSGYIFSSEITNSAVASRDLLDGPIGLKYVRYNKVINNVTHVILECWVDVNGDGKGWAKFATLDDYTGSNAFGNSGDMSKCGASNSRAAGTWGSGEMLFRWDDANSDIRFKSLSVVKIDPAAGPGSGGGGGGGGGGSTQQVTEVTYAITKYYNDLSWLGAVISHEICEAITDKDPKGSFTNPPNKSAWRSRNLATWWEVCDVCIDAIVTYNAGSSSHVVYVQGYYSNDHGGFECRAPGASDSTPPCDDGIISDNIVPIFTKQVDTIMKNPRVWLVFWGWNDTGSDKTQMDRLITMCKDMMGAQKNYFSELDQYGMLSLPTYAGSVNNKVTPTPNATLIGPNEIGPFLKDTFDRGILQVPEQFNDNLYFVVPLGKYDVSSDQKSKAGGFHNIFHLTLTKSGTPQPGPGPEPEPAPAMIDSFGIQWLFATGEQTVNEQTRFDPGDHRWSKNYDSIYGGYEITGIFTFHGADDSPDGAHWACKMWGSNHTPPCPHQEQSSCCCWYDVGIRGPGTVYTQIERPHPHNIDVPCPECKMSNIGMSMNGNTIGLKWLVVPIRPDATADDGGIRLMMWKSTPGLTGGVPTNNWQLVFDITDNGQILGNYKAPDDQEIETRNSDTDSADQYGGGMHVRRLEPGDMEPKQPGPPPPGPPPPGPPEPPPEPITGFFGFDLKSHFNFVRGSPCLSNIGGGGGGSPPDPPPPGGGDDKICYNYTTKDTELGNNLDHNGDCFGEKCKNHDSFIWNKKISKGRYWITKKGAGTDIDWCIFDESGNIIKTLSTVLASSLTVDVETQVDVTVTVSAPNTYAIDNHDSIGFRVNTAHGSASSTNFMSIKRDKNSTYNAYSSVRSDYDNGSFSEQTGDISCILWEY